MKWIRSNIRQGSRLALFALAVQFVLAFGHFHGISAQAAPVAVSDATQQQPSSSPDSDQPTSDFCAVCAVIAMANTTLFATPPLLLLPQAVESSYLTSGAGFTELNPPRAAFQPRAPPIS